MKRQIITVLFITCLFATSFFSLSSAASPQTPIGKAIFDYAYSFSDADTTYLATNFDTVILNEPLDPSGILAVAEEIKTKNPAITILIYRELQTIYWEAGGYDDWAEVNTHEDWFLHDVSGNRIMNTDNFWMLLDAGNIEWQAHLVSVLNTKLASPFYDGVFLDDAHDELPNWWTLNGTVQAGNIASWHSDVLSILNNVHTNLTVGKQMIINSDQLGEYDFLTYCDGILIEDYAHPNWLFDYQNNEEWFVMQKINDLNYITNTLGKICLTNSGTSSSPITDDMVQYNYAAFLLGVDGAGFFSFNGVNPIQSFHTIMDTDIGDSVGDYYVSQDVYMRTFADGLVLFNPSASDYSISLTGYHFLNDTAADSFTLDSYSGEVLFLDAPEPTPSPTSTASPTPIPTATPVPTATPYISTAQAATNQVFTNVYLALGIAVVSTLIAGCYIIIAAFNSGNGNARFGVGLVIVSIIEVVIGVVVVSAFQGSMGTVGIIFLSFKGVT
jgi:hypothetical protein